ncbi:calmodulin-4-like [Saccostrea echinata]|uniref:calmodulin-4-like n=1 Tax=Saccostrea echinata TaxID=191078 RepID=UPI002A81E9E3|nr:calmodulin-4-like [Saccostrea echinata]
MKVAAILIVCLFHGSVILSKSLKEKDERLSCNIRRYDLDSDGKIQREEFLKATLGYKKHDPEKLFERLDMDKDGEIEYAEFRKSAPGLQRDGVLGPCKRKWCIGICLWK